MAKEAPLLTRSYKPKHLLPGNIRVTDDDGVLQMKPDQWAALQLKITPECAFHLIEEAEEYAENNPKKFEKYTDHARMILNWYRRKIQDGYEWFNHTNHGPGFYKVWLRRDYEIK